MRLARVGLGRVRLARVRLLPRTGPARPGSRAGRLPGTRVPALPELTWTELTWTELALAELLLTGSPAGPLLRPRCLPLARVAEAVPAARPWRPALSLLRSGGPPRSCIPRMAAELRACPRPAT
jgi:hypothetical protein